MNRYTVDLCFSWNKVYIWTDCSLPERATRLAIKMLVLTWECSCGIVLHSSGWIWNFRFSLDTSTVMWFELEYPRLYLTPYQGRSKILLHVFDDQRTLHYFLYRIILLCYRYTSFLVSNDDQSIFLLQETELRSQAYKLELSLNHSLENVSVYIQCGD